MRRLLLVVLCVVAAGLVPSVKPVHAVPEAPTQVPTVASGPPPLPVVESAGTLGKLTEPAFIAGHDKGQSTLYDNGQGLRFSYWSFGDTLVDRPDPLSDYFIGNTAARTTDTNMNDNIGAWTYDNTDGAGHPHEAFPLPPGYSASEYRVWGGSVVADPANDRMIGIYHIIQGSPGTSRGYGLALWSEATQTWTATAIANPTDPARPYVLWPESSRVFNTGMILDGGYMYTYGCYTSFRCSLARVSVTNPAAVANRASWTFYTGAGGTGCAAGTWSADVNCAQPLQSAERDFFGNPVAMLGGAAGMSVFRNDYTGTYMAIYSSPGSGHILYSVAERLEGPWSAPGLIAEGAPPPVSGQVNYAGYAHPEFAEQNGKIQYVTYARYLGSLRSEFGLMKVTFGTTPATFQRRTTGEGYFGDSGGTRRISAAGPMAVDTTGTQPSGTETAAWDRQGSIYAPGAAVARTAAVVRIDGHSSTDPAALGGLVMRNSVSLAHNGVFTTAGQGYVALVSAPGGGVSLRWDSDGDQDLDSRLPATPNSVTAPVWLRLVRTGATSYQGFYSTNSTNGTDGTWTSVGTATVPTAAAKQDVALVAAGPSAAAVNRTVFSNFEIRPGWISSWTTSVALNTGGPGTTYQSGFQNQTVRNIVHSSLGGTSARVRVSNAFGTAPLVVSAATVGLPAASGMPNLDPASVRSLAFGGQASVTIPAGGEVYSDPVALTIPADQDIAVSLYFNAATGTPTWHRYALRDTYVYAGNRAADATGTGFITPSPQAWYYVSAVDVLNEQALGGVLALGDSTTDGVGTSSNNRWTDKLADRLAAAGTLRVAVANQGSAGAQVEGAPARLSRDVLSQSGARTVVVKLGINDLIDGSPLPAADIIAHYRTIASQARLNGMRVLVSTITPLGVHTTAANEPIRQDVNAFLRTTKEFDGLVDLDAALRDPATPTQIRTEWAAAVGSVHPNAAGHQVIADTFNLATLLQPPRTR